MSEMLDLVTVEDFKCQFPRNFPYFTQKGPFAKPKPNGASAEDYVLDCDIERAFKEADACYNISLLGKDDTGKLIFLYLAAFYLAYDLSVAAGGAFGQVNFPATSVKVGSVSESYYIPDSIANNPMLSLYMSNGFGKKYLSLVYPKLVGNVGVVAGWSQP